MCRALELLTSVYLFICMSVWFFCTHTRVFTYHLICLHLIRGMCQLKEGRDQEPFPRQRRPTFKAQYWYLVIWWFRSLYRSRGVNMTLKGPAHWLNKMKRWCLRLCWGKRNLRWWTRGKNAEFRVYETEKRSDYSLCHDYTWFLRFWERSNIIS